MRHSFFRLPAMILCATSLLAPSSRVIAQADRAKVVAMVNGESITQKDVDEVFRGMVGDRADSATPESLARMRAESEPAIIEQLISKSLLMKVAAEQELPPDAVELAIAEVKKALRPGELKEMKWTEEKLRTEVTNDLKINQLIEQRAAMLDAPDDAEMKAYYNSHVKEFTMSAYVVPRHILISTDGVTGDGLRQKRLEAERLRLKLNASNGANFAELSKAHSACPSAKNGGRLGKMGKGQMPKAFDAVAFSQPIGEISSVVETDLGFHILIVDERQEATMLPLQQAAPRIAQILMAARKQRVMNDYVAVLKTRARIQRF